MKKGREETERSLPINKHNMTLAIGLSWFLYSTTAIHKKGFRKVLVTAGFVLCLPSKGLVWRNEINLVECKWNKGGAQKGLVNSFY